MCRSTSLWAAALVAALLGISPVQGQVGAHADRGHTIWVGAQHKLIKQDVGQSHLGAYEEVAGVSARAIAVDSGSGKVWVYGDGGVSAYTSGGAQLWDIALAPAPRGPQSGLLELNASRDGAWLAIGSRLRKISSHGTVEVDITFPNPITALSVDSARDLLWIAFARDGLAVLAQDGSQVPLNLELDLGVVSALAYDGFSDLMWVAGKDVLATLDASGALVSQLIAPGISHLVVQNSVIWWASKSSVYSLHPSDFIQFELQPFNSQTPIVALVGDGASAAWAATNQGVVRIDVSGDVTHRIDLSAVILGGRVWALGVDEPPGLPVFDGVRASTGCVLK